MKKPGILSGILVIPEEKAKKFRYNIDNGNVFWYSINTRRKNKKLPVLQKRGVNNE